MGGKAFLHMCFGGFASTSTNKQPSASIEYLCHRFSFSQLRKSTDDFDKSRIIGEGPYGVAYRASISVNGQLKHVAVKRLSQQDSKGISLYKKDIIFLCQLHHPNLVSLVGFCHDQNEMIVVYEYAPNGSLQGQLRSKSPALSWKKRLEISIGVARGLHYLHSGTKRTIIYRNFSPATILLGENWVPKLSFLGHSIKGPKFSAKDVKPIQVGLHVGTAGYIAPGYMLDTDFTYKYDVYSFGAVLLELICGERPCQIMRQHEVSHIKELRNLAKTGNGEGIIDERLVGEIAAECWELYMDIAESCLSEDPNERPDMGDVEVQLERMLQLQEEADANHASHAFFISFLSF